MIVVYTAQFGAMSPSIAPVSRRDRHTASFYCFTDQIRPAVDGWKYLRFKQTTDPRWSTKLCKFRPHQWFPEATLSIWMDAAFRLVKPIDVLISAALSKQADLVAFQHPDRSRIREEAQAIIKLGYADPEVVAAQVNAYTAEGFGVGRHTQRVMTAGGFLVREHCPKTLAFNQRWEAECTRFTSRDQLSLDYVAWKTDLKIAHIGTYKRNNYLAHLRYRKMAA